MIETIYPMGGQEFNVRSVIKETIREINQNMSLLTEDLIKKVESETKTREEYIAFMKGAAFIFYRIAQREPKVKYDNSSPISSPREAIEHMHKLLPFMAGDEKIEHLKMISWFNELLEFRGEEQIPLPKEYLSDEEISAAINELNSRLHREEHERFEKTKTY